MRYIHWKYQILDGPEAASAKQLASCNIIESYTTGLWNMWKSPVQTFYLRSLVKCCGMTCRKEPECQGHHQPSLSALQLP